MAEIEFADYRPVGKPARLRGDLDRIRAAAAALKAAERPLILSGGGAIAADPVN